MQWTLEDSAFSIYSYLSSIIKHYCKIEQISRNMQLKAHFKYDGYFVNNSGTNSSVAFLVGLKMTMHKPETGICMLKMLIKRWKQILHSTQVHRKQEIDFENCSVGCSRFYFYVH